MKNSNPKFIAINNSFFISIISLASMGILIFLEPHFGIWIIIPLILVQFFIVFWIFYHSLRKFIYEKIRIIYKNIHNFKVNKDHFSPKSYSDNELFEQVNKEVLKWAVDKKSEIETLKKLEVFRREFLGNVSHELKTPITSIQGYILTLLDGGLEDAEINKKYLVRTEQNIKRMIEIVDDLEAISKLETGELKLHLVKFDIVVLTKEILEILEFKASEAKVEILFAEQYEPIMVIGDRESIQKVLTNLIENSIKYCRSESGKTKISFLDMDENILIEITDNGIGIDKEYIPRLFERFFRVDKARSRDKGGSGLGLAIVKHIIEAHHQTINVRSTIGIGSTFAFTLKKGK